MCEHQFIRKHERFRAFWPSGVLAVAIAGSLWLSGCSGSSSADQPPSTSTPVDGVAPEDAAIPEMPKSATPGGASWSAVVAEFNQMETASNKALDRELSTCMAKAGFVYSAGSGASSQTSDEPYNPFDSDPEWAQQHGYIPREAYDDNNVLIQDGYAADDSGGNDSPEYLAALAGDLDTAKNVDVTSPLDDSPIAGMAEPDGCMKEAYQSIYGSADAGLSFQSSIFVVNDILTLVSYKAATDPEMIEAIDKWKACMTKAGFETGSQFEDLENRDWPEPRPSDEERRTATQDQRCRAEVGLGELYRRLADQYLEPQVPLINELLDEMRNVASSFQT